jgi:hypothetical protein
LCTDGTIKSRLADSVPEGWKHWLRRREISLEEGFAAAQWEVDLLRADAGRHLGFTRIVARRKHDSP